MNKKLKGTNYIDKEELFDLIVKFKKHGAAKMSVKDYNRLGSMILLLVRQIATKPNFSNYTYLDEMKSHAVVTIVRALDKFDPEKTINAFSYLTTTCINAFIFIINKERTNRERMSNLHVEMNDEAMRRDPYRFAKKKFTRELKTSNKWFDE